MQTNVQPTTTLADYLSGQAIAMPPGYWHSVAGELATIGPTITAADIQQRREAQAGKIISMDTGQVVETANGLNDYQRTPNGSIAHLQLAGLMLSQDYLFFRGVHHLAAEMIAADNNPNVSGILLEVNSGGGMFTAGQMLLSTMQSIKKPVYVLAHYMASAAVLATLPARVIVASSPGVEVGSIGTYIQINESAIQAEKKTIKTIYAAKSTLKNKLLRAVFAGDYSPYEKYVNEVNEMFLASVKKHRTKATPATMTGEVFFAETAKRNGLIDMIGSFQDVVRWMANHLKVEENARKLNQARRNNAAAVKAAQQAAQTRQMTEAIVARLNAPKKTAPPPPPPPEVKTWMLNPINQRAKAVNNNQGLSTKK